MSLTMSLLMDPGDVEKFTAYLEGMITRTQRSQLVGKIMSAFEPVVAQERANIKHSISGALVASLTARSGGASRDRPGTISVFSAPTATTRTLMATWRSDGARKQQQGWRLKTKLSARNRVFYGPMVHQGHRIVKRNAAGQLYDTGKRTEPVPFASEAMEELGEAQSEVAADMILEHIVNGGE